MVCLTKGRNSMKKTVLLWMFCLLSAVRIAAQQPAILENIRDKEACRQWVDRQMESMTLKQKVGQLFIHTVQPDYTQFNKNMLRKIIDNYGIGGLLFSSGEMEKQVKLTNYVQQVSKVPLFIAFDGEWGLAMRLKGTPRFAYNRVLGCISNDTLIYDYGREVARQLRSIGVQINFAPVADVDNNPENPVINFRSFGSRPQDVADKVAAYVRGLEDGGVLAVCKHFPGHGDTRTDSHKELPRLYFNRERLDSVELYPFRKAVGAGVGGMMTGHLHVPALGEKPASISQDIISFLKDELRFKGLVFTDALEMKGISGNENVCAQALIAGNDMVLAPRNLKRELKGVMDAIRKGCLTEADIDGKCRKVLTFKYALGLADCRPVSLDEAAQSLQADTVGALQRRMAREAVTVARDSDGLLPLDLSVPGTVLLSVSPTLTEAYPFYKRINETLPVGWVHADGDSLAVIERRLRPVQRVIVALHSDDILPYDSLLTSLAKDKPLALVCFTDMKTLEKVPELLKRATAVVLAHTGTEEIQQYVADLFLGRGYADGRLSVPLGDVFASGAGVTVDPEHPHEYVPEDLGMDSSVLARIDTIAREGISGKAYPGCHVLILRNGFPVYNKHFGKHTYEGSRPVAENDIYDLASVTKISATLLAVMKLYDEGKFGLTDRVSDYLPYLKKTDKSRITVQDLLFHESGLPAYWPFYREAINLKSCKGGLFKKKRDANHQVKVGGNLYACTNFKYKPEWVSADSSACSLRLSDSLYLNKGFRDEIIRQLVKVPAKGNSYRYSCLNFMLLKELVETVSGKPMDEYLDSVFYKPMGLVHTAFCPLRKFGKEQIVPTAEEDFLRGGPVWGYVQDEAAAFMGGVSGNAGLFSSARDVARICQMLLDKGVCGGRRYLTRATCELFTTLKSNGSRRGLGFDKPDTEHPDHSPCAAEAPASVFGHTGFTGTAVWMDPDNGLVFVFLSNRTYPSASDPNRLALLNIRTRMQQAMYQSIKE